MHHNKKNCRTQTHQSIVDAVQYKIWSEKFQWCRNHFGVSYGKEAENRWASGLVSNACRHCEVSDGGEWSWWILPAPECICRHW